MLNQVWMQIGYNTKDKLTNIFGVVGLIGTLIVISSESGFIDAKYSKQGQGLIGASTAVALFAAGKRGDLMGGQIDNASNKKEDTK